MKVLVTELPHNEQICQFAESKTCSCAYYHTKCPLKQTYEEWCDVSDNKYECYLLEEIRHFNIMEHRNRGY